MSDNKEPNVSLDLFSQYMQQRLKGHTLPLDPGCWTEIEDRLKDKPKAAFRKTALYIAAAVLGILLLISYPWQKATLPVVEKPVEITEVFTPEEPVLIAEGGGVGKPEETVKLEGTVKPGETRGAEEQGEQEEVEEAEEPEELEEPEKAEEPKKAGDGFLPEYKEEVFQYVPKKRKKDLHLSAGFGTGGNGSFLSLGEGSDRYGDSPSNGNGLNNGTNGSNGHIPIPPGYFGVLQPEDFEDIDYNIPLSFGVMVRKDISKHIAIESGLVYTYLSTHMKISGFPRYEGKLGLHYLGIPVHIVGNLWRTNNWNVYVSGGVMVEKGLRSIYTQHGYRQGLINETTIKTSISGMQFSLNASLGVSYRLYKEWSLYAEPRVSYFFDGDQPISIRTEQPVSVGIGAGLRFQFK